jgi:hypothetical protein
MTFVGSLQGTEAKRRSVSAFLRLRSQARYAKPHIRRAGEVFGSGVCISSSVKIASLIPDGLASCGGTTTKERHAGWTMALVVFHFRR